MITRTYLDSRLRELEDRVERRIKAEIDRVLAKINADISNLKSATGETGEIGVESKDILLTNYAQLHDELKKDFKELKARVEKIEQAVQERGGNKREGEKKMERTEEESDMITSDIE